MPDWPELHRRAADTFGSRVRLVTDDQWDDPTPCEDWDVRALVHHVVEEERWIPYLVEGMTIEEVGDRLSGNLLGDDPAASWEAAAAGGVEAFAQEGAMERMVQLSSGPVLASEYATEIFTDVLIHGWDLSRAIGADDGLDPELVEECWQAWSGREFKIRDAGVYGSQVDVPDDADLQTRLLALFGRDAGG